MGKIICKIDGIDNGFCRVDYKAKNKAGQTVYYCIQEEFERVFVCYRLSCWEGFREPDYEVVCDKSQWETPTGDSTIEKNVRRFLEEKELHHCSNCSGSVSQDRNKDWICSDCKIIIIIET